MKWKNKFGVSLGNMLEHYDIAVFAAISVYLIKELESQNITQAAEIIWGIFALRYILRPVGGYIIGRFADKKGKKSSLILISVITGFSTFLMALLPIDLLGGYTPIAILILQSLLCFSFAGEYPSLINYLLYNTAENERSRTSSLAASSSLLGFVIAFFIVFTLENILTKQEMETIGWRIPLLLGLINILMSFWFRMKLSEQPVNVIKPERIDIKGVFRVFILTIPVTVTFYTQNVSWSFIIEYLPLDEIKKYYILLSSILLLTAISICSWLTDKFSSSLKIFKIGIYALTILSIPIYYIMSIGNVFLIILSQIIMTVYIAMIWCNSAAILERISNGRISTLGLGFNFAVVIFGGVSPLIINQLMPFGMVFIGVFLCACGLVLLINRGFDEKDEQVTL